MRRNCKKDNNHHDIIKVFQKFGFTCIDTSNSDGDLLDFIAYLDFGFFQFVEVKNGKYWKLTECEKKFIDKHSKHCVIIENEDQASQFCAFAIAEKKF